MKYCNHCGASSPNHCTKCIGCYRKLPKIDVNADQWVFSGVVVCFIVSLIWGI